MITDDECIISFMNECLPHLQDSTFSEAFWPFVSGESADKGVDKGAGAPSAGPSPRTLSTAADADSEPVNVNALLLKASYKGREDVVDRLLNAEARCDVGDNTGRTSVHQAAAGGNVAVLAKVLDRCSDPKQAVNMADWKGWTPLHIAVVKKNPEVVKMLINAGADIHAEISHALAPNRGLTKSAPIHLAAIRAATNVFDVLVDAGASPVAEDRSGHRPLHYAAWNDDEASFMHILGQDTSTDAMSHQKRTAVHVAAIKGNKVYTEKLIELGYSTSLKDCWDMTPSVLACLHGHSEVAAMLDRKTLSSTKGGSKEEVAPCDGAATGVSDETVIQALMMFLDEHKHPEKTQIPRAVKRVGAEKCLKILMEVTSISKNQGLPLTADRTRPKSMGGTFLTMLKEQVSHEDWVYIRAEVKEHEKAVKKRSLARPRKNTNSPRRNSPRKSSPRRAEGSGVSGIVF